MNTLSGNLNGISDIEILPAPPPGWEVLTVIIVGVFAILAVVISVYTRFYSGRYAYVKKLKRLNRSYSLHQTDSHETAFQLAKLLQQCFALHTLSDVSKLPKQIESHRVRWQAFINKLDIARYAPVVCTDNDMQFLFVDALFFLRRLS